MKDRVVLAYSGGLDTSVAARGLRDERDLEVVAAFVDLGQPFDPAEVRERAARAGAELRVIDARARFAEEFCLPALHANALYEGRYPLVSALARPLIASLVVETAKEAGAKFVAHGCTGKGNDQVRFETSFAALAPELGILAPVRQASQSREESIAKARAWGIPISHESKTYSIDENLWGRTAECGPLEDPWVEPPPEAFALTGDPAAAPDRPAEVVVGFEAGRPVTLDGERLPLIELIARLTVLAGRHGYGRVDMLENRLVGIKSRELYEVPAALALIRAHRDLESLTLERELAHEKAGLERRWAELCYYGQWHGPLHAGLRTFMAESQGRVTGEVRLRLFKGSCAVVGRRSPLGLYDFSLATYDRAGDRFDQGHAEGFISLWALPLRVWAERGDSADEVSTVSAGSEEAPAGAESPRAVPLVVEPQEARIPTEPERNPAAPVGAAEPAPVWRGRFSAEPDRAAMAFTRSLPFDRRLAVQDLMATQAHVRALWRAGVLDAGERERFEATLAELLATARGGGFPFDEEDEDVHSAVERVLTERLGSLGGCVHAGRSRNDLVATDLRLWSREAGRELAARVCTLCGVLAGRAEEHVETVMPGYTHLQRAQPVTLGHVLLAHAFALVRDAERLDRAAAAAAALSPLGAGALAGSSLGLDPEATALDLGFDRAFDNSIDAVADRDFALELLAACVTTAVHLSRLGEDVVLWCSQEFGFATPDDRHATGSSMMPQKRNPDVAELARAKAGRILGDLVSLVTVMKGLPLAYDRDLQEDKEAVFDAFDSLLPALAVFGEMLGSLRFDAARMRQAADDGFMGATDLAERLVRSGVPFREAHRRVAALVATLESEHRTLTDVKPDEWAELDSGLDPDAELLLSADAAVAARSLPGGPSPASVWRQIERLRSSLRS